MHHQSILQPCDIGEEDGWKLEVLCGLQGTQQGKVPDRFPIPVIEELI